MHLRGVTQGQRYIVDAVRGHADQPHCQDYPQVYATKHLSNGMQVCGGRLTLALSDRAMSAAARRRRMMARRARGAHTLTFHGPLERVVRRLHASGLRLEEPESPRKTPTAEKR